jgi:hypothetical protein
VLARMLARNVAIEEALVEVVRTEVSRSLANQA